MDEPKQNKTQASYEIHPPYRMPLDSPYADVSGYLGSHHHHQQDRKSTRTTMTALEILTGARALLSDKGAWYQGALGMLSDGTVVHDSESVVNAPCRCMVGAIVTIERQPYSFGNPDVDELIREATGIHEDDGIGEWNDDPSRKHSEVLEAFDKAIELAKERNL